MIKRAKEYVMDVKQLENLKRIATKIRIDYSKPDLQCAIRSSGRRVVYCRDSGGPLLSQNGNRRD